MKISNIQYLLSDKIMSCIRAEKAIHLLTYCLLVYILPGANKQPMNNKILCIGLGMKGQCQFWVW